MGPASAFYHSGEGLVCEGCHRSERTHDRERTLTRENSVDCALNGGVGLLVGVGAALFGLFTVNVSARALGLFAFGVAVTFATLGRAVRFPATTRHRNMWLFAALAGSGMGGLSFVVLVIRMFV